MVRANTAFARALVAPDPVAVSRHTAHSSASDASGAGRLSPAPGILRLQLLRLVREPSRPHLFAGKFFFRPPWKTRCFLFAGKRAAPFTSQKFTFRCLQAGFTAEPKT